MTIPAEDRARLAALARAAVEAEAGGCSLPSPPLAEGIMGQKRGCFVTLTNRGRLRGCIGTFVPDAPLGELVIEMGSAAARDPRFVSQPVTPAEAPSLKVEVSVLSPLQETANPLALELGKHGIYIVRGAQAGCFLPEVATEMGWTVEEFLDECCSGKAGMPGGAWRQPGTRVYLFTSEKFDH